jgi:hypothetical protein
LRAIFTARGYELDPNFICGPFYGQIIVGPLVDIVALPPGSIENATVMGMDANGNLIFCTPDGKQPLAVQATSPNNTAYGSPKAFALDNNDLYILDPQTNGVWYYRDMDHANPPHLFFGDEIPPLQDVTDITVANGDLYLLHSDGHVTKCTLSEFEGAPTRCEDPLLYSDDRPGRGPGEVIPDALFSQLYYSPPPGPSIYMLDPKNHAIYHMSLRLAFQNQFRPQDVPSEGQATAFAVSPLISAQRTAFLANGNQVYYASLP